MAAAAAEAPPGATAAAAAAATELVVAVGTWTSDAPAPLLYFFPGDERWWGLLMVKIPLVIDCKWVDLN